ncbi:MAG: hypothetical protein B7Y31_11460, partial [Novosphingobium sp. 16-62-11]
MAHQLKHGLPRSRRVDRDIGHVVARSYALDEIGLPRKVEAVEPVLLEHPELAAALVRWSQHDQRGIIAALLVRIVTQPHRLVAKGTATGHIDQRRVEIAPFEEAVHPRRVQASIGEAALRIVHILAFEQVAKRIFRIFAAQLFHVDQRGKPHRAGIMDRQALLPRSIGHDRAAPQVLQADIERLLIALRAAPVPLLARPEGIAFVRLGRWRGEIGLFVDLVGGHAAGHLG